MLNSGQARSAQDLDKVREEGSHIGYVRRYYLIMIATPTSEGQDSCHKNKRNATKGMK